MMMLSTLGWTCSGFSNWGRPLFRRRCDAYGGIGMWRWAMQLLLMIHQSDSIRMCPAGCTLCASPMWLASGLPISWGSRTSGKYETSNTSYRVNFNWEPSPDHLIYAGVTTSYRAGGFNMGGQ